MKRQFSGRVALVTGAGSGIGRATALLFANKGAKVVVADVVEGHGNETVLLIEQAGSEAIFVKTDVTKAGDVQALINKVIQEYGQLNYACNNAAVDGEQGPLAVCSEQNWDLVVDVNLKGVWLCMKYEIIQMLKQGGGAIVNIASVAGLVGIQGMSAYCASKHGVLGLTKSGALEYAKFGIRVNAVCPGATLTPMVKKIILAQPEVEKTMKTSHPLGRFAEPEEIAEGVVWLCSDAASFVTGHHLMLDGGFVAQ